MGFIDSMIGVISPAAEERRTAARLQAEKNKLATKAVQNAAGLITNSGYSHGGASHNRPATKRWRSDSGSPERDIEENRKTLRERSRDLYMKSALGAAAINSTRTNVVGEGLVPKPKFDFDFLGITYLSIYHLPGKKASYIPACSPSSGEKNAEWEDNKRTMCYNLN